jgi:hypothetical protein
MSMLPIPCSGEEQASLVRPRIALCRPPASGCASTGSPGCQATTALEARAPQVGYIGNGIPTQRRPPSRAGPRSGMGRLEPFTRGRRAVTNGWRPVAQGDPVLTRRRSEWPRWGLTAPVNNAGRPPGTRLRAGPVPSVRCSSRVPSRPSCIARGGGPCLRGPCRNRTR